MIRFKDLHNILILVLENCLRYHSHPFDVGQHSHCFLSQTDVSTQLQWQRAEDPHGNPFLAIVVDPLRSAAKNTPILKAFRCYPPEYNNPVPNTCPNGEVINEEQGRLEQWGSCWSSYYELNVEYFMSSGARNVLSLLTQSFLWMRALGTAEHDGKCSCAERIGRAAEKIRRLDVGSGGERDGRGAVDSMPPEFDQGDRRGGVPRGRATSNPRSTIGGGFVPSAGVSSGPKGDIKPAATAKEDVSEFGKACQAVVDIATEKLVESIAQVSKKELFTS
jgi:hypothetical protein